MAEQEEKNRGSDAGEPCAPPHDNGADDDSSRDAANAPVGDEAAGEVGGEEASGIGAEPAPQEGREGGADEEHEAEETVEDLREKLEAQKDRYLRLMAEFDNYRRRTSKEYNRLVETANERLMLEIIEVRESIARALEMGEKKSDYHTFYDGIKLIFSKLEEILTKNGLEVFGGPGDEFDPAIHDAMMKTSHEEIPEDHIVQIYQKGYALKGRVIKHAQVIVSSGPPVTEDAGGGASAEEKAVHESNGGES